MTRPRRSRASSRGYTLLEAMIAVVVLSLLASMAMPSYVEYIRRSARTDAQLVLQQAANHLERLYAECNSYLVRDASTVPPCTTATGGLPAELTRSPREGRQQYTVSLTEVGAQGWALAAAPLDASDACGTFTMRSTGERTVTGALGIDRCWRR